MKSFPIVERKPAEGRIEYRTAPELIEYKTERDQSPWPLKEIRGYWLPNDIQDVTSNLKQGRLTIEYVPWSILEVIEKSKWILALESDWNDECALPISNETWKRTTNFLEAHAKWMVGVFGIEIKAPQIGPVPDGSIDLHWKTEEMELLINVPTNLNSPATFYGDDFGLIRIEGTVSLLGYNRGLLAWLMRLENVGN